jgi:uncharacterized protein (DUF1800 family)
MAGINRLKNQHLLWRAGFGPTAEQSASLDDTNPKKLWKQLLESSSDAPTKLNVVSGSFDDMLMGAKDMDGVKNLSGDQKKAIRQESVEDLKTLNLQWLDQMVSSDAQLTEKMSLFWHGHFACRIINIYFQQGLLDIVRSNALENFGDLLKAVSKSPAMLQFLNNQQNRKQHPNENFAREVMELFTLGRGNYTEDDVKEAARAFTGWSFDLTGQYIFRPHQHDDGMKTFLGETGAFDGDDILNILLKQQQTANFITKKMYKFFVNDMTDDTHVSWLAERFYNNNYDIKKLLEDIFTSDWFYDEKNIGIQIKSPIVLMVGIRRFLPMQLDDEAGQLLIQHLLGQVLFYPPNVAGWPGGKSWIDSSTLMLRLRLPQIINANEAIDMLPKTDDDAMMGRSFDEERTFKQNKAFATKLGSATINWTDVIKIFKHATIDDLLQNISLVLFQTNSRIDETLIKRYCNTATKETFIETAVIELMSTPEYQFC